MRSWLLGLVFPLLASTFLLIAAPLPALAGDLADEADLLFQLGTEAYAKGDFRSALQHFLASNRLVPNRNVLFNIARSEERLADWPAAWRYYAAALEGEVDAVQAARVSEAMARVLPHVVVLDVRSEPPGAEVYVGRKDLGVRGVTPLSLGLGAGDHTLVVERAGFEPESVVVARASVGERRTVNVALRPILGVLVVEGSERGANVYVGSSASEPSCTIPCRLELKPGRVLVRIARPGHRTKRHELDVLPRGTVTLRPRLSALTGTLLLETDEPGALISVDGKGRGFTPAVLVLPVGLHEVTVTREGYFPITRTLSITRGQPRKLELTLVEARQVQAASRSTKLVDDAPGSVSLVESHELRAMAYPTLGDALRGVRGMQLSDDRSYVSLGIRGLTTLGSYGNRALVLIDGQPTNDNWVGSSFVGYDLRTDLSDVERIEVVRGPGSVLYGTNAVGGVVNLVMRRAGDKPRLEAGLSAVGAGVGRARLRGEVPLPGDVRAWVSIAGSHSRGDDYHFEEYEGDAYQPSGDALDADAARTTTLSGGAEWRSLRLSYHLHNHDKRVPTGEYQTLLGHPRTHQRDQRGFVEVSAEPEVVPGLYSFTRVHMNDYRFRGDYARPESEGGVEHDTFDGTWVGAEQRLTLDATQALRFVVGGEGQRHMTVHQTAADNGGTYLDDSHPFNVGAVYAVLEGAAKVARVALGGRLDYYSTFGTSLNPRASVILKPWNQGNVEVLFGRAFRAPSPYESYYDDGITISTGNSPNLNPETTYSGEVEVSHRFSPTVVGTLATYGNAASDLIVGRGAGTSTDPFRYENSPVPVVTVGGEVELRRSLRQGWTAAVSYGIARSQYLRSDALSDVLALEREPSLRDVPNVPVHSGALFGSAPTGLRDVLVSSRLTWQGARSDRMEESSNPEPQREVADAVVWDVVFTGKVPRFDLAWALGVYNAFDTRWYVPVSGEFRQRTIRQAGRTFLLTTEMGF